jgi:hypothetical protein
MMIEPFPELRKACPCHTASHIASFLVLCHVPANALVTHLNFVMTAISHNTWGRERDDLSLSRQMTDKLADDT